MCDCHQYFNEDSKNIFFRWQIEFKTIAQNAIVLYNAGGGRSDFLAVEILEGAVRVKMARGQILHTMRVNDGQWHKLHLLFNPSLIEVGGRNNDMIIVFVFCYNFGAPLQKRSFFSILLFIQVLRNY